LKTLLPTDEADAETVATDPRRCLTPARLASVDFVDDAADLGFTATVLGLMV